jgi:hypothetical protein
MTSQLNVDTIVDKAGTSGPSLPNTTTIKMGNTSTYVSDGGAVTQNTVQGLAKVWISYNGSTNAILGSLNVTSVTDIAAGHYKNNYTNSFETASAYSVALGAGLASSGRPIDAFQNGTALTGSVTVFPSRATTGAMADTDQATSTCFGDLA